MSHEFKVRIDDIDLGDEEEAAIREEIQQVVMRRVARLDFSRKVQPAILPLGNDIRGGHTQGIWVKALDQEQFGLFDEGR